MSSLWHMTVSGTVLIAAAACVRSLFLDRLGKALFPALWLVAAVRLLTPVSVPVPVPAGAMALLPAAGPAREAESAGGFPWLTALWLAGALILAGAMLLRHVRALRQYAQSLPAEDARLAALTAAAGLRRPVSVRVCQTVSTPLTYGFLRPVILLPKDWESYGPRELALVLDHELAHIRRLDVPAKYILAAAACVHWFNPFVWAMCALAERDIELACDEAVLRRAEDDRAAYAMALITLEERRGRDMLLSGFGLRAVRERVTEIMQYRRRGLRGSLAGAAILLCSLTVFATAAAASPAIQGPNVTPTPYPNLFVSEEIIPTEAPEPVDFMPASSTPDPIPWEPAS